MSRIEWRWVGLYLATLLLVLAVIYTFSLQFEQSGYGLTRTQDLGIGWV